MACPQATFREGGFLVTVSPPHPLPRDAFPVGSLTSDLPAVAGVFPGKWNSQQELGWLAGGGERSALGPGGGGGGRCLTLTLPAGSVVVVARIAQADVARHRVEAPAVLAETGPKHHTLVGICGRAELRRGEGEKQDGAVLRTRGSKAGLAGVESWPCHLPGG